MRSGEYQEERKTEQHATVDALQIRAQTEHWAAEITSSSKCRTEEVSYGCSLLPSIPPSRKNKKRIGSGRTPRTVTSARNIIAKLRRSRTRRQKTRPLKQRLRHSSTLAEVLRLNTTVTWLDLDSNYLGEGGGRSLADALRLDTTVTSIDLESNYLGGPALPGGPGEGGERALAEALHLNNTLASIDLGNNYLGEGGGRALAEALRLNTTLASRWQRHSASTPRWRRSTSTTITEKRAEGGHLQRHCDSTPRSRCSTSARMAPRPFVLPEWKYGQHFAA